MALSIRLMLPAICNRRNAMKTKPIVKPPIKESLMYGDIISWKFRDTITPERKKYAYRFSLTFSNGVIHPMQKGGFHTKTEAAKAREITISQLHSKTFIPFEYSLQEFYDFWLYYYMLDERKITYGTYMSYRNVIYNYLLKLWDARRKISSIERNDINHVLDSISKKSVLKTTYNVLRTSFLYAKEHQIICVNPTLTAIRAKKKKEKKALLQGIKEGKISIQPKQYPILSVQETANLLLRCKEEEPITYLPLLLSLTAGLRISETIAVKYSDIDWGSGELRVYRQLGRSTTNEGELEGRIITQELKTKTRSGERIVPLADFVVDELILARQKYEAARNSNPDFKDLDYVCCHENGAPFNRSSFRKSFKRLLRSCNLPDMRWHDLRHTYATILKQKEISLKAIAVCMGHYGTQITEDVYINLPDEIYDCDKEITAFMEEVLPKQSKVLDARFDEKYLLEVLPHKVYNITDCIINTG